MYLFRLLVVFLSITFSKCIKTQDYSVPNRDLDPSSYTQRFDDLGLVYNDLRTNPGVTVQTITSFESEHVKAVSFLRHTTNAYIVLIQLHRSCNTMSAEKRLATMYNMTTTDIQLLMQNRIGPDEIIVQLEGNTLQTEVALSTNFCDKYEATFQV